MDDDNEKQKKDAEGNLINAKTKKKIGADGKPEEDEDKPDKVSEGAINTPGDAISQAASAALKQSQADAEARLRTARRVALRSFGQTSGSVVGNIQQTQKQSGTSDAAPDPAATNSSPFSINPFNKKPKPK